MPDGSSARAPVLEVRGLRAGYGTAPDTIRDVSLSIEPGQIVGLVGESGCGKSTLAKVVLGLLRPREGDVLVDGRRWGDRSSRDPLRSCVQMVFQDPYASLNPKLTAAETVADSFRRWKGSSRRDALDEARRLLDRVGLPRTAIDARAERLSGGQCQRVGVARALACEPRLLVADEPTSSLDVSVQAQILNLLLELQEGMGMSMLLISHDLSVIRYMTSEAMVMSGGAVVEHGSTAAMLRQPRHPYTRTLVESIPGQVADWA
ncbi:ATP-binding cassette domain-containing protein [Nocardioides ginsengisoli]|uniref:ABC transporter ATP-binding protein n=1 Tax=Nocardioides ginsengisoli TaxID=363868 RepID=A0ABW3W6Y3_9ACTN